MGKRWTASQIEAKNNRKAEIRRQQSIKLMEGYKGLYDCKECIHGIINSCRDRLPKGCEYFKDEIKGRQFEPRIELADWEAMNSQHLKEIMAG